MSYIIEFDRQFIRSTRGITPVWLCGENNITTGRGRDEKVYRKWDVFLNILGVTKEEFLAQIKPIMGSDEHWKKGSKWVDDDGLIKWVENGCRQALPVEDIIECNYFNCIDCEVVVYGSPHTRVILKKQVSSTFEFDSWLDQAKEEIKAAKTIGNEACPIISFNSGERITHSTQAGRKGSDKILVKKKGRYLAGWSSSSTSWSVNINKAMVMTYEEAIKAADQSYPLLNGAQYVSAKALENPGNLIVKITKGKLAGRYLNKLTRTKIYHSPSINSARKYSTKAAAQKAANRVVEILKADAAAEVMEYNEE